MDILQRVELDSFFDEIFNLSSETTELYASMMPKSKVNQLLGGLMNHSKDGKILMNYGLAACLKQMKEQKLERNQIVKQTEEIAAMLSKAVECLTISIQLALIISRD